MWLSPFNPCLSSSYPKIDTVLRSLQKMNLTTYIPSKHLHTVVGKENLPEKTLKDTLRLGYFWSLSFIPENQRTLKICLTAVQQKGSDLQYVPENQRTAEICMVAVKQSGSVLQHVPKNLRIAEICMIAVQQDGGTLFHVPENQRTPEICLAAVQQNGRALQFVPENLRTYDICLAAGATNWVRSSIYSKKSEN
jgi:hypothetical protein